MKCLCQVNRHFQRRPLCFCLNHCHPGPVRRECYISFFLLLNGQEAFPPGRLPWPPCGAGSATPVAMASRVEGGENPGWPVQAAQVSWGASESAFQTIFVKKECLPPRERLRCGDLFVKWLKLFTVPFPVVQNALHSRNALCGVPPWGFSGTSEMLCWASHPTSIQCC